MLIIDTKEGQSIRIDNNCLLTVVEINYHSKSVSIRLSCHNTNHLFFFKPGMTIEILPNVRLMMIEVAKGQYIEAKLGFKAPKEIVIRGTWIRKNEGIQLTSLTDKEIVDHSLQVGSTTLEKELTERLRSRL